MRSGGPEPDLERRCGLAPFEPDFKAYDEDGRADLYWNSIIGAVRKNYGAETIEGLFESLHGCSKEQLFEQLLWLGLKRRLPAGGSRRPALPSLRRSYARRAVALDQRADPGDPAGHAGKRPLLQGPGAERTAPAAQGPGNAGCPGVPRRPGRPCHCGAGPGIPPHLFPFHPRRDPGPGVGGAETAPAPLFAFRRRSEADLLPAVRPLATGSGSIW